MKAKSLAVLAGVVLALGAYILLFERHQPTTIEAKNQEALVFVDLETQSVISLAISNTYGDFVFDRSASGWRLSKPVEYDAASSAVDAVINAMAEMKRERTLTPDDVAPSSYGLESPIATVTLTTYDQQTRTLAVGNQTALGAKRAVTTDGGSVILTKNAFFATVNKDLNDWRSREVASVSLDQTAAISVTTSSGIVETMNLGETWLLRSPVDDLADKNHIQNLITGLNGLQVREFVDPGADLAGLGLAEPQATALLVMADGSPSLSLEFGATRDQGGVTEVACRRNSTDLFWVNSSADAALNKAAVLWRDPNVMTFERWNVSALSLQEGSSNVNLSKENGSWILGDDKEANPEETQKRLTALAELKAIEFDLISLGTAEMGRAIVTFDGLSEPITYTFYEPLEKGGNVLVSVSGRNTIMSVAPESVASIIANLDTLHPEDTPEPETAVDQTQPH